jgi:hypothetical protein
MFTKCSRIFALASALSFLGFGIASATPMIHLVSAHGAQPRSNAMQTAHGMAATQKHAFVRMHKSSGKKAGLHGFVNGQPNGKKTH